MAYKRSCTRGASSSLPQRDGSHIGRPTLPVSQPVNTSQSYSHGQMHASDQPLTFSASGGSMEGSQHSFPSHLSTHPWTCDATDQNSGPTSELGSARGVSCYTPSTPTSPQCGDIQDLLGDVPPCEHHSSNDPDGTLQGISSSNHDTGIYNLENTFSSNLPYDSRCQGWFNYPETRLDYIPAISAEIPARSNPLQDPWSQVARYYDGQSFPGDVVDEGHIFQQFRGYDCWRPGLIQGSFRPRGWQEGLRNKSYHCYPTMQQHSQSPAARQDYTYRENGTTDSGSPSSSSSTNAGSPASATTVALRRTGGRTGPLTDDGRRNADFMRKNGCCYRCFIMREKCILDEQSKSDKTCKRCRKILNNPRSWRLPCTRIGLDERAKFVVPGFMKNQLESSQVSNFLKTHVDSLVPASSIVLHLTIGFSEPLILDHVEVVLKGQGAVIMRGVGPAHDGSSPIVELNSPPIFPYLADQKALQRHVNKWLDTVIQEPDSELPEHCFPEAHEHWQRVILTIICKYYQRMIPKLESDGSGPYHALRRALKLTLLNHLMCHPFVVPEEEVQNLYNKLRGPYSFNADKLVCPRLTNKVIKCMLLPMLNILALQVLTELQKLLRTRRSEENLWDPLFCIIFLCLIVVGKFQVSFLERVEVGLLNHDFSFLKNNAICGIEEMEDELSTHLIGQFHACFGTNRRGNGNGKLFNPLARDRTLNSSWLAEEVSFATQTYGSHIFNQKELPLQELGEMKEKNVTRLLANFMEHFF